MMNLFTIYKINELLSILPFTSAKPIENIGDQSKRLFTRVEGIKGPLAGHEVCDNSLLSGVVNGIYMIEVKLDEEIHEYLGKAVSERGIEDRVCRHINKLRGLPMRHEIISIILKKNEFKDLSKNEARVLFRSLEFQDYEEIGSFFDEGSDNPFSNLSRKIRLNVSSFEEQQKFFYENVRIGICHIETGLSRPSSVHEVLVSLLELFFLKAYKEEKNRLPSLNTILPGEENLLDRLKKLDQNEIETTLAKYYPSPFSNLINRKIEENSK